MNAAATEQPQPVSQQESEEVLPWVLKLLLDNGRHALADDLLERARMGEERYGTPLMSHNGRSAVMDLYQELLDALMYLAQYQMETNRSDRDIVEKWVELKSVAIWVKENLVAEAEKKAVERSEGTTVR